MASFSGLTSFTPPSVRTEDTTGYWLGVEFYVTAPVHLSQIKFYNPPASSDESRSVALYDVASQTILTPTESGGISAERTGPVAMGAWVAKTLTSPILLTPNTRYRAAVQFPGGLYASTPGFYTTGSGASNLVNGPLVIVNDANSSAGQNTYVTWGGGEPANPLSTFDGSNYWLDVTVTDDYINDTTPPSVPANVTATAQSFTSVQVSWTASTDETGVSSYRIRRNGIALAGAGTVTGTTFSDMTASQGTQYTYTVSAVDANGQRSAESSAASVRTPSEWSLWNGTQEATLELDGIWNGTSAVAVASTVVHDGLEVQPPSSPALEGLARVAWEGGPAYYQQFPRLAGTEWTTDAFFPIIYWGAYVNEQSRIQTDASLGINAFSELYAPVNGSSAWMRSAGIWNLGYDPDSDGGAEHVGNFLPDEADMWAGSGWNAWNGVYGPGASANSGYTAVKTIADANPNDGRMRYYNGGKGMLMWQSDADARVYMDGYDPRNGNSYPLHMVSGDLYFYTDGNLHGGEPQTPGETTTFFGRPRELTRRAGNYGELAMHRMRQLDALNGHYKPLGILVELASQQSMDPAAFGYAIMAPEYIVGAVWSTLIYEARFVTYFSHGFGEQATSDALNHPAGNTYFDAMKVAVGTLNAQIKALAPVLNSQSYEWEFNANVSTMLKGRNQYAYVFAQQKVRTQTSGTYEFALPPNFPASGTVEVLHESRTISYTDGVFTDSFAQEYTTHIYRIEIGEY